MLRIPVLSRNEMDAEQQKVYDATVATTGRVGRGPSVGYAYSPGLWQVHNASSAHLLDCSLTQAQVLDRVAQNRATLERRLPLERASPEGVGRRRPAERARSHQNAREQPKFTDRADEVRARCGARAARHRVTERGQLQGG